MLYVPWLGKVVIVGTSRAEVPFLPVFLFLSVFLFLLILYILQTLYSFFSFFLFSFLPFSFFFPFPFFFPPPPPPFSSSFLRSVSFSTGRPETGYLEDNNLASLSSCLCLPSRETTNVRHQAHLTIIQFILLFLCLICVCGISACAHLYRHMVGRRRVSGIVLSHGPLKLSVSVRLAGQEASRFCMPLLSNSRVTGTALYSGFFCVCVLRR